MVCSALELILKERIIKDIRMNGIKYNLIIPDAAVLFKITLRGKVNYPGLSVVLIMIPDLVYVYIALHSELHMSVLEEASNDCLNRHCSPHGPLPHHCI